MEGHAYSHYCRHPYSQYCNYSDLEELVVLNDYQSESGDVKEKTAICRCRVCGGFYKYISDEMYFPHGLFDTDEGWSRTWKYFKIDEPRRNTLGSALDVPFTIDEARKYGYTGEVYSWKNGRCNFPVQNYELTCRAGDLEFVAKVTKEAWAHLENKLYKCRRCGEWYFYTPLPPHPKGLFKPSNELFPVDFAKAHGFVPNAERETFAPTDFNSLARMAKKSDDLNDWNALFSALFALPEWVTIGCGQLPNFYPYAAPPNVGGEPWVRIFTDVERVRRFVRETNLADKNISWIIGYIPTAKVFKDVGNHPLPNIAGVWVNCDSRSESFLIPIDKLRPLTENYCIEKMDREQPVITIRVIVQEALRLPEENIRETPYKVTFYCRVPANWLENNQLKPEFWKEIGEQIFGKNWDAELLSAAQYFIKNFQTHILADEWVKNYNWNQIERGDDLFYFFIGYENGEARKISAQEFQKNVNADFQNS